MTSLMVLTPSSISPLCPTIVVSSANKDTVTTLVSASLLYFSHRLPLGKEFPGCHLHFTPTSSPRSPFLLFLSSSASLITTWWKMMKRVGDVAHPSLRPLSGVHSSLSFSLTFTQYTVASCRSFRLLRKFPLRTYLSNIPTGQVYVPWGRPFVSPAILPPGHLLFPPLPPSFFSFS